MKLTKTKLKQIIKEELQTLAERKLPPLQDPDIASQWEQIKPALEQLANTFRDSFTGPHHVMAVDLLAFIKKTDAGMRFVSYGEQERVETIMHREPVSSFS